MVTTRLAALWLASASACWTGGAPAPAAPEPGSAAAPAPAGRCPERLVGVVHDAATGAPLAGAIVVVEIARGRIADALTDAAGRFETASIRLPARLRIYHGEHAVERPLAACQPPLRIGVRRAR